MVGIGIISFITEMTYRKDLAVANLKQIKVRAKPNNANWIELDLRKDRLGFISPI